MDHRTEDTSASPTVKRWSAMVGLLLLAGTGCRQLPPPEWEPVQLIRQSLQSIEAGEYAPQWTSAFEDRFQTLRVEVLDAAGRPWRAKAVQDSLEQSLFEARMILLGVAREKDRLRQGQLENILWTERMIQEASSASYDRRVRRSLGLLKAKLERIRELWQEGEYLRAGERLEEIGALQASLQEAVGTVEQRLRDPDRIGEWKQWVQETIQWSGSHGRPVVVVDKFLRRARVYDRGRPSNEFSVELGWAGLKDKLQQGDGATPEGRYKVVRKKDRGSTLYHRALLLNYPNSLDREAFERAGKEGLVPRGAGIGGLIEIHGEGGEGWDWTDGCVALRNEDMDRLFDLAYEGMPVTVVGRWME